MQGDCLCSPPAFLYTTSYTIFICCEGVTMNHKDFIKNYLPGLTRGVYAVRLLLKVAPTYIAALLICNILSGILTSIELLLSQNFLNSLTVFLSGYITIETLLFWLISIFLASVAMSGCTYVSSCLNSLVSLQVKSHPFLSVPAALPPLVLGREWNRFLLSE